jgi:carbamoyltransferase
MDLAASIQVITEEIVLKLARSLRQDTGATDLCLSGGVALNCVANGRLLREGPFERLWIQPAAGDAGGAVQLGRIDCIAGCGARWRRMLGGTTHRTGLLGHKFGRQPRRSIGDEPSRQDLLLTRSGNKRRCCVFLLDDELASA